MRVITIGLGNQRPPRHFRELLALGPVLARDSDAAAAWLGDTEIPIIDLGHCFELDAVASIPETLLATFHGASRDHETVCYLVPGAGNIGDESVCLIGLEFDLQVHPGLIQLPAAGGDVRIVDALALALAENAYPFDAGLASLDPHVATVVTNYRGRCVKELAGRRLERYVGAGERQIHGDTLVIPARTEPAGTAAFAGLERIVALLRSPDGCPWDREQTVDSLLPQLDEELDEFREAWRAGDAAEQAEELGDVLLHVVMMAQIARESGAFDASDVVRSISAKMVRRHPHVFGDREIGSIEELYSMWDEIKSQEKSDEGRQSVL